MKIILVPASFGRSLSMEAKSKIGKDLKSKNKTYYVDYVKIKSLNLDLILNRITEMH